MDVGEGEGKRLGLPGMRGTRLTGTLGRQALSDRLALKPYWGKPTARNFRGGRWRRRHHRSPVRAIALPDIYWCNTLHGPKRTFGFSGLLPGQADPDYLLFVVKPIRTNELVS